MKYATPVIPRDPKNKSSRSNATMAYECNRFVSDPMIMKYNAKNALYVITLNVNVNNRQSKGNFQSTDINDADVFEAGNKTEILCM